MTRARRTANGVMTPPPLYRWIDAVLLLCVSLVQGAVSTLKMIAVRCTRECHTKAPHADLPHATNSIFETGTNQSLSSFSGKPKAHPENPGSLIVGTAGIPRAATNRDARDKPEHDSVGVDASGSVEHAFPAQAGIQSARNARSSATHTACHPGRRAATIRDPFVRIQNLQNGSRLALRLAGMTTTRT